MSNLKYKTRGNSTPQRKPRVYFCCHSEDFNRYFKSVSDEILAKQNCAIWYTDEEVVRDDNFFASLKQMQLFVMPVTTNLLCTENEALDTEFKFAIQNHIPVLPLMQESGLEELFNKKCGDLQFLDKHNTDVTAISYDEKLQKYLESVLIGDELAEKIRAAFDAYVFLSYRKKDRKYAQELMRLIHKNEFCRDIAIWYDEFLTPGENFNDSIKEALQKSGLFVLAVTPNLVNETNYIMTTEYPMAKQEGKPILPAELVPTDREQLSQKYEDIPNPTDAYNEVELSEALLESIKKMAIKENDASPEHNFFIGLAYLGGVDVEVDHKRAVALITSAAEAGLVEAIEKLVYMYENGIGVTTNIHKSIKYQIKLIDYHRRNFAKSNSEDDLFMLLDALIICGKMYISAGLNEEAKKQYDMALQINQQASDRFDSKYIKYQTYVCYSSLGDIFSNLGWQENAIKYYFEAIEILLTLALETDMVGLKNELCKTYNRAGSAYEDLCNYEEAMECYNYALEISEKECDTAGIGESISQIASLLERQGNPIEALNMYKKARSIYKHLAEETLSDTYYHNMAIIYSKMGQIFESIKQFDQAWQMYSESLEIKEELVQRTNSFLFKVSLAGTYSDAAILFSLTGQHNESLKLMQTAVRIREELVQKSDLISLKRELSASYNNMANLLATMGHIDKAIELFVRTVEIIEEIAHSSQNVQYKLDLCEACDNLGNIYRLLKRRDEAMTMFQKSTTVINGISSEKSDRSVLYQRAFSLLNLGLIEENFEMLEKAYQEFDMLSRSYPDVLDYAQKRDFVAKKISQIFPNKPSCPSPSSLFSKIKDIFKK